MPTILRSPVAPSASHLIDSNYKTPLQIFSSEVTAAAKKRLPNLDSAQLHKIVVDKWTKMSEREKQVYRTKSLAYAKVINSRKGVTASSGTLTTTTTVAGLTTVLSTRAGTTTTTAGGVVTLGGGAGGSFILNSGRGIARISTGGDRTIVQKRDGAAVGAAAASNANGGMGTRYEVCLQQPSGTGTGIRLRAARVDPAEPVKRYKLTELTEDMKRSFNAQLVTKKFSSGVIQRVGPTVFRPGAATEASNSVADGEIARPRIKLVVRNPKAGLPAAVISEENHERY